MNSFLKNISILITGGTGSFGKEFVKTIIEKHSEVKRIVIFSRDELKQYQMSLKYPEKKYPNIRFFIGDVRDKDRLYRALDDIDIVVHSAALKQVETAEYNPFEYIKTNVLGAQNLIEVCLDKRIKNVIALSTDKAVSPINLYGATKLCSDKLFLAANNVRGKRDIKFSVARYGNVMGSRGSVIPFFLKQKKGGYLPITDLKMTRFNISLPQTVDMVLWILKNNSGGEIFVPKVPSFRIIDLATAVDPNCRIKVIGIRPGEKIHETLMTGDESDKAIDIGKFYVVLQDGNFNKNKLYYGKKLKTLKKNFSYSSDTNSDFLSVKDLKKIINSF